ncbi:MAG: DDE-type integrase/transposase/recombinase, partial [Syntrophobacterales bacterium]|nr:DDE-type integrase/transposase/recombinase [Syntrophobacterales bacterium]
MDFVAQHDITYIWTFDGFVYLTSIMDLFSRKIVAWSLSTTLEAAWIVDTVRKAIKDRGVNPYVMHTDRGIQYVSY